MCCSQILKGLLARRDVSVGWYDQEDVVAVIVGGGLGGATGDYNGHILPYIWGTVEGVE